jgi:hypothetical protein
MKVRTTQDNDFTGASNVRFARLKLDLRLAKSECEDDSFAEGSLPR